MKKLRLISLASFALIAVAAQAGTIVYHLNDGLHPTAGVELYSEATSGDIVDMNAGYTVYPSVAGTGDTWVVGIDADFFHSHDGAQSNTSPPFPETGTETATGDVDGNAFWWFEYVPDNVNDVPDTSGPYYATIQVRGNCYVYQGGHAQPRVPQGIYSVGGVNGLLTQTLSTFTFPGMIFAENSSGNPWNLYTADAGFVFQWNASLGKWIGKPTWLHSATIQFSSLIQVLDDNSGFFTADAHRELKVLQVRSPSNQTFTFNSPWT